jgi:hypothetical protein
MPVEVARALYESLYDSPFPIGRDYPLIKAGVEWLGRRANEEA